jgi:hypothetical protein
VRKTKFITPQEKNLVIRMLHQGDVDYSEFAEMLYNARYDIISSQMMDHNKAEI